MARHLLQIVEDPPRAGIQADQAITSLPKEETNDLAVVLCKLILN
jgi:hypothetical protein